MCKDVILSVGGLCVSFDDKLVVDDVSFSIDKGEVFALTGQSGCGKTTIANAILGLLDSGASVKGKIVFEGVDLCGLSDKSMRKYRGGEIAMIFQHPSSSLNPVLKVGKQMADVIMLHRGISRREAEGEASELLEDMGISEVGEVLGSYPHELSGGMIQRVMIGMALGCRSKLIIADEPTSSLDLSSEGAVIEQLERIGASEKTALLLITHDIDIASGMADDIAVMYDSRIVESGSREAVCSSAVHPYTKMLVRMNAGLGGGGVDFGVNSGGSDRGCPFANVCSVGVDRERCRVENPVMVEAEAGHYVRCHFPEKGPEPVIKRG